MNIEALHAEHARLSKLMRSQEGVGTPARLKIIQAHRLLTDLINLNGGTPAQRVYVAKRLAEMEAT